MGMYDQEKRKFTEIATQTEYLGSPMIVDWWNMKYHRLVFKNAKR